MGARSRSPLAERPAEEGAEEADCADTPPTEGGPLLLCEEAADSEDCCCCCCFCWWL